MKDTPQFRFRCSYRNMVSHDVLGSSETKEVEEYYPLEWLEETERKWFNGDADEYTRTIEARIGGIVNQCGTYRMSYPLWQAYVNWKVQKHLDDIAHIKAHPEKYGEYTPEPVQVPKPMYWDHTLNTYAIEPWYIPQ